MANQAPTLIAPDPRYNLMRQQRTFIENFDDYVTGDEWTLVSGDSGTAVLQDLINDRLLITPGDGTINNECYIKSTKQRFSFADGYSIKIKAAIKFAQAATNKAAVYFGLMSGVAADAIVDTTGVPKASWSGAIFYTIAGSIYWQVAVSVGTGIITKSTNIIAGGSLAQELEIDIKCVNGVADVQFRVNGTQPLNETTVFSDPIKLSLTTSGFAVMNSFVGVKQCSAVSQPITWCWYAEQIGYGSW